MMKTDCSCLTQETAIPRGKKISCRDWIEYCLENYSEECPRRFSSTIRETCVYPVLKDVVMNELSAVHFAEIRSRILGRYSVGPSRESLRSLYRMIELAVEDGIIPRNPIPVEMKSVPDNRIRDDVRRTPYYLTDNQICKLRLLINVSPKRAALSLAATTGIPKCSLFALKWEDLDFAKGELCVRRKLSEVGPKRDVCVNLPPKKIRKIILPGYLLAELGEDRDRMLQKRRVDQRYNSENYMFTNKVGGRADVDHLGFELECIGKELGMERFVYGNLIDNAINYAIKRGVHIRYVMEYYANSANAKRLRQIYRKNREEKACVREVDLWKDFTGV